MPRLVTLLGKAVDIAKRAGQLCGEEATACADASSNLSYYGTEAPDIVQPRPSSYHRRRFAASMGWRRCTWHAAAATIWLVPNGDRRGDRREDCRGASEYNVCTRCRRGERARTRQRPQGDHGGRVEQLVDPRNGGADVVPPRPSSNRSKVFGISDASSVLCWAYGMEAMEVLFEATAYSLHATEALGATDNERAVNTADAPLLRHGIEAAGIVDSNIIVLVQVEAWGIADTSNEARRSYGMEATNNRAHDVHAGGDAGNRGHFARGVRVMRDGDDSRHGHAERGARVRSRGVGGGSG